MLSDLSEYHHIDLVKALRTGDPSPRMLLARLRSLPDTAALPAAVSGVPRGWGGDRHALITLIDAIQVNTWVTASTGSSKRPKRPKPIPRPEARRGARSSGRRVVRVADLI